MQPLEPLIYKGLRHFGCIFAKIFRKLFMKVISLYIKVFKKFVIFATVQKWSKIYQERRETIEGTNGLLQDRNEAL